MNLPMWRCLTDLMAQTYSGRQLLAFTKDGFYRQLDWSKGFVIFYNNENSKHRIYDEVLYTYFKKVEPSDFN